MTSFQLRGKAKNFLLKIEGKVHAFLVLLSTIAIGLVISNEFVAQDTVLPLLNLHWTELQTGLRATIWALFVAEFAVYALISGNIFLYARRHVLELIVCIAWIPHQQAGLVRHINHLLSLEMLQLIGTIAHSWRVARWTIRRFSEHPLIVTGSIALVIVASAAALLNLVEPQTFPNIWDGLWYSLVTITTIGYGDLVPRTAAGRAIGSVLIICGVSLAGVFIGLISEMVRKRLVKANAEKTGSPPPTGQANPDGNALDRQILEELRTNNRLLTELLAETRKRPGKEDGGTEGDKPKEPGADADGKQ